jgi:hypothetical protein
MSLLKGVPPAKVAAGLASCKQQAGMQAGKTKASLR